MQLDPARYHHHFDRYDMSEDAKLDYMRHMWAILGNFASREFHKQTDAIWLGIDRTKRVPAAQDRLDSDHTLSTTFNDAAGETMAGKTIP